MKNIIVCIKFFGHFYDLYSVIYFFLRIMHIAVFFFYFNIVIEFATKFNVANFISL